MRAGRKQEPAPISATITAGGHSNLQSKREREREIDEGRGDGEERRKKGGGKGTREEGQGWGACSFPVCDSPQASEAAEREERKKEMGACGHLRCVLVSLQPSGFT